MGNAHINELVTQNNYDSEYSNNVLHSQIIQRKYEDEDLENSQDEHNETPEHQNPPIPDNNNNDIQPPQHNNITTEDTIPANPLDDKALPPHRPPSRTHTPTIPLPSSNISSRNCPLHGIPTLLPQCTCSLGKSEYTPYKNQIQHNHNCLLRNGPLLYKNTSLFHIENEYRKNKQIMDNDEKTMTYQLKQIPPPRYINTYNLLTKLHNATITFICPFAPNPRDIGYATSALDKTIKLWTINFDLIDVLKLTTFPSVYLAHYRTKRLLSAESLYIKIYDITTSFTLKHILKDHNDDVLTLLVLSDDLTIASAGVDKVIRLWNVKESKCFRYLEGHDNTVKKLANINNKTNIISLGDDKTFIIWDIHSGQQVVIFNNYFNSTDVIATEFGFACGAYDNKIRLFNKDYKMFGVLYGDFYGSDNYVMLSEKDLLFVNEKNEIWVVDLVRKSRRFVYEGIKGDIVKVVKGCDWDYKGEDCDWNAEVNRGGNSWSKDKVIVVVTEDGYVYEYQVYFDVKQKVIMVDNY
jgi:WD40 repeat protein